MLEFVADFGELPAGTRLAFRVAGEPSARAHLPVELAGAEIVAVDSYGRPALLRHELGAGRAVLCTYPLEHMAARTPWVNPENTWRIYSALASLAGVVREVHVEDPRVLAGVLRGGSTDAAVFVNCSADTVSLEPAAPSPSGGATWPLAIEPLGAVAVRLDRPAQGRSLTLTASALTKGGRQTSDLQAKG